jgi:hypothetical protein
MPTPQQYPYGAGGLRRPLEAGVGCYSAFGKGSGEASLDLGEHFE